MTARVGAHKLVSLKWFHILSIYIWNTKLESDADSNGVCSKFRDIYDEDHFIHILEKHVHIVKKIPDALMERFDYNISNITILKVKARAPAAYYTTVVYPLLNRQKYVPCNTLCVLVGFFSFCRGYMVFNIYACFFSFIRVIRIAPFANRLALDVPPSIQVLRCLTNYKALRFSDPIRALASKLVARMKKISSAVGGKYISVHLRFEEVQGNSQLFNSYTMSPRMLAYI